MRGRHVRRRWALLALSSFIQTVNRAKMSLFESQKAAKQSIGMYVSCIRLSMVSIGLLGVGVEDLILF